MTTALPHRVLAFYGDDFTGSTDAMEVAAMAGLDPVLFTNTPDEAGIAAFPDARAVGIAGISRSQDPAWMDRELPPIFEVLGSLGAPFVHYKVCSTFDSAPHVGNIGRAAEIGLAAFRNRPAPVVVGAPALKRFVAFGNLFAAVRGETFRIDRHPVMSRHPITPMAEADLRRHLAAQTDRTIGLIDLPELMAADPDGDWLDAHRTSDLLLFDTVDAASLERTGRLLWSMSTRGGEPVFAVGSSGLQYALVAAWRSLGLLPPAPTMAPITPAERVFAVSGSCSPVTSAQIDHALANGFHGIEANPAELAASDEARARTTEDCVVALGKGRDVLLFTARGPDTVLDLGGTGDSERFNDRLGGALGRVLMDVIARSGLRRAVVAGGDTSSHAVRELGLQALRFAAPLVPGSPLCRAFGWKDGELEIALKGGQMGQDDFFVRAKNG